MDSGNYTQRLSHLSGIDMEDMLEELLATLHGDGGHYTDQHGFAKSVADAEMNVDERRAEFSRLYRLAQDVIDNSTSDYTKCGDDYRVPARQWLDLHAQVLHLQRCLLTPGYAEATSSAAQLVAASPAAAAQQQQREEEPQEEHSGILDLMGQCKCARCKPVHLAVNDAEQDFRDERALSDAAPVAWVCRYKPDGKWMLFDVRPLVKDSVMECLPVTRPTDLPAVFDELIAFEDTSEVQPRFSDAVRIALAAKNRTTVAASSPAAAAGVPTGLKPAHGMPGFTDIGGGLVVTDSIVERIASALASSSRHLIATSSPSLASSHPVAPVGAPSEEVSEIAEEYSASRYGGTADSIIAMSKEIQRLRALLSAQGCELATDATKQQSLTDEQITAMHRSPDVRDALLAYFDVPNDKEASGVIRTIISHLAATPIDQDFRRRPASSEAAPSAEGSE